MYVYIFICKPKCVCVCIYINTPVCGCLLALKLLFSMKHLNNSLLF